MPNMSNYLESGVLSLLFRSGSFSKPSTIAIALATGTLNENMGGALGGKEVPNAGGYARVYLNPSDSNWTNIAQTTPEDSGYVKNQFNITFPQATANWDGTVTDVAILDTGSYNGGNLLFYGKLSSSRVVQQNDQFIISSNNLSVFLD